jgi:hypothetical protein
VGARFFQKQPDENEHDYNTERSGMVASSLYVQMDEYFAKMLEEYIDTMQMTEEVNPFFK